MLKAIATATALVLTTLTAVPIGHATSLDPSMTASTPLTKDLGVPSRLQTAPLRIISGDAGQDTINLAYYCYYRYVADIWGNLYTQYVCW